MGIKNDISYILNMSKKDRSEYAAKNGFQEVALTYIQKALESGDQAMLKYLIEVSMEIDAPSPKNERSSNDILADIRDGLKFE